ncbi:MAG: hypothetical protein B6V02_00040 [Thermoprotei archaeon ex4572_64]|nr:MAG: hypothetical protein B6V02_00040 [Thermoprotei archaeon ex4572_64]
MKEELTIKGEKILKRRRGWIIENEEIDLLIETEKYVYVIEVKLQPKHSHIGELLSKVDLVKKYFPEKDVKPILIGSLIGKEIVSYAVSKGVEVY